MGGRLTTYLKHKDDPKKYQDFYQSYEWRKLSLKIKEQSHFLCEDCWKRDVLAIARVTHHIDLIRTQTGWKRRLDPTNLTAICNVCHEKTHNRLGGQSQNKTKESQLQQIKTNRAATIEELMGGGTG